MSKLKKEKPKLTHPDLFPVLQVNFLLLVVSSIWTKKGDHIISEAIESLGSWEISYVEKVMKAMDYYPNAVFIGS